MLHDVEEAAASDVDPSPLESLAATAVQGKVALGPGAGAHAPRLGRGSESGGEYRRGKLCADHDGFSLHAGVRIPEFCSERRRYAGRPPVVHERLLLSNDGTKVIYKLKRKFRDGSTAVVLEPLDFIARLAALVPRPRVHLTTYHGVFAPASSFRDYVVPPPPAEEATPERCHHLYCKQAAAEPDAKPTKRRRRHSWAELMKRVADSALGEVVGANDSPVVAVVLARCRGL